MLHVDTINPQEANREDVLVQSNKKIHKRKEVSSKNMVTNFTIHDIETAPKKSKKLLEESLRSFGMIPNLHGVMAEAPSLLEAYQVVHELFQASSFDKEELTVIWQTINVEHECHYCIPAHSAIAKMMGVDANLTKALLEKTTMPTEKLEILHQVTLILVRNRGQIDDSKLEEFFQAGFTKQHLLEIILGISQKVMSNYVNQLFATPIDAAFLDKQRSL